MEELIEKRIEREKKKMYENSTSVSTVGIRRLASSEKLQQQPALQVMIVFVCIILVILLLFLSYRLYLTIRDDLISAANAIADFVVSGGNDIVAAEALIQEQVLQATQTISNQTVSVVNTIANAVTDIIDLFINTTTGFVTQVVNLVETQTVAMTNGLLAVMAPIVEGVAALLNSIMFYIQDFGEDFADFIGGVIDAIVSTVT